MGVVSLGIGLWLYISFNEFAAVSDGERLLGAVFLVATGFGVVIVGFLGIVAALCESRIIASAVSSGESRERGRGECLVKTLSGMYNMTLTSSSSAELLVFSISVLELIHPFCLAHAPLAFFYMLGKGQKEV